MDDYCLGGRDRDSTMVFVNKEHYWVIGFFHLQTKLPQGVLGKKLWSIDKYMLGYICGLQEFIILQFPALFLLLPTTARHFSNRATTVFLKFYAIMYQEKFEQCWPNISNNHPPRRTLPVFLSSHFFSVNIVIGLVAFGNVFSFPLF